MGTWLVILLWLSYLHIVLTAETKPGLSFDFVKAGYSCAVSVAAELYTETLEYLEFFLPFLCVQVTLVS